MASKTFYPNTISETSCSSCRDWSDKANLKKESDYSQCGSGSSTIAGKTGTRKNPSALTLTNFKVSIPTGAMITKITVEYAHQKVAYQGGVPNIPAPTISLVGVSGQSGTGVAPTTTMTAKSKSFSFKPATSSITSSKFGVKINYPSNANTNPGYLRLKYVRIVVTYTEASYSMSISKAENNTKYTGDTINLNVGINNLKKVNYSPTVTITLPAGVTYNNKVSGTGSFKKVGSNIVWSPDLSSSKASSTAVIKLNLTTEGSKTVKITENLNKKSASVSIKVNSRIETNTRTESETINSDYDKQNATVQDSVQHKSSTTLHVKAKVDFPIILEIDISGFENSIVFQQFYLNANVDGINLLQARDKLLDWTEDDGKLDDSWIYHTSEANNEFSGGDSQVLVKDNKAYIFLSSKEIIIGRLTVYLCSAYGSDVYVQDFIVETIPDLTNLTTPVCYLLKIEGEELNRLGDEYVYTVESSLKEVTSEEYVRQWGKNFCLGVFNNAIPENIHSKYHLATNSGSIFSKSLEIPQQYVNKNNYLQFECVRGDFFVSCEELNITRWELTPSRNKFIVPFDDISIVNLYVQPNLEQHLIEVNPCELKVNVYDSITYNIITLEEYVFSIVNSIIEPAELEESIDITNYDNLSIKELFKNADYWSEPLSAVNTFESKTVEFSYDEDYPLYVLFTGDYIEGNPLESVLLFTSPTIKESNTESTTDQCIFPIPIKGMISDEENDSELTLSSFTSSNTIVLYDFDVGDIETNNNLSVLGVQLNLTVDLSDDVIISVKLKNHEGKSGERSLLINKDDKIDRVLTIGGTYDLWGFDITDMVNLDTWEVEISFNNPWNNDDDSILQLEKVELIFFVNEIDDQIVKCYINGKDTRHYGMFIEEVDVPAGLKTAVKYLDIDGSDINNAYRQNIDKKEITIKFSVNGCTIKETTSLLKMLGQLFSNARDELNRPIPNKLEFSHYPDEFWNVILEEPIDADVDVVEYTGTLKLIVPDGTSYSNSEKITGVVGTNNSIAKVSPLIDVIITEPTNSVEIVETQSKQHMVINYDDLQSNDILEIDCSNRKVFLNRYSESISDYIELDVSEAVDWQADWFTLFGYYYFESKNCIIQTISFLERG